MHSKRVIWALTVIVFCFLAGVSFATQVNFNDWSDPVSGSSYTWTVSDGSWTGSEVKTTSVPASPEGLFLSAADAINYTVTGKLEVVNSADNDMIGLVFGYQGANDYYVLDWKKAAQTYSGATASEGFTVFKIDGSGVDFWNHPTTASNILYTQYGTSEGWNNYIEYDFVLTYTSSYFSIIISENGTELFNQTINGTFSAGKYGAYNFSQANTLYSDFEISSVPIPAGFWLLGSGLIGLICIRRRKIH